MKSDNKFIKLMKFAILHPFFWFSCLMPKSKKIWVFGAWFGNKYADNSKYFFEYVNKYHPDIKAIWLTNDNEAYKLIKNKGYKVYYTNSISGLIYSSFAKVGIISTFFNDINIHTMCRIKVVQLWHGSPLKKIANDDKLKIKTKKERIKELLIYLLVPSFYKNNERILFVSSASEVVSKSLSSAFNLSKDKVKVTGYPRNDSFFNKEDNSVKMVHVLKELKNKGKNIIIYMPTHRNEGELDIGKLFFSNLQTIDKRLEELNSILLIKLHYYHGGQGSSINGDMYSNIKIINDEDINQDIYSILTLTDMLITDYSSIYFDYLLSGKPIIFSPFDIDDYIKNDREFYYDYDSVTPGPKAKNWDEVLNYIERFLEKPDWYSEERRNINEMFNKFRDGGYSERVFNEIMKLI